MENSKKINIQTKIGAQHIDSSRVITFPQGVMGFESKHLFSLIKIHPSAPFFLLQCITDSSFAPIVTDPYPFIPQYTIKISAPAKKILQINSLKQVAILVTVGIPRGNPNLSVLNLTGPILINHASKIGLQVPQEHLRISNKLYSYSNGHISSPNTPKNVFM